MGYKMSVSSDSASDEEFLQECLQLFPHNPTNFINYRIKNCKLFEKCSLKYIKIGSLLKGNDAYHYIQIYRQYKNIYKVTKSTSENRK